MDEFYSFDKMKHLSVSTVNSFISYKSNFIESKLKGKPFRPSANMARGTAVEAGLNAYMNGAGIETAVLQAHTVYKNELEQNKFDKEKADTLYSTIEGCVLAACSHYKPIIAEKGRPLMQEKFEVKISGIKRPIVGYLDYKFADQIDDLKCVSKSPYGLSQGYKIQGSVYRHVYDNDVFFNHVVATKDPKVVPIKLTDNDYTFGLNYFIKAAIALEEMIDACEAKDPFLVLEKFAFPDLSQVWDEEEKKEIAKQYGI